MKRRSFLWAVGGGLISRPIYRATGGGTGLIGTSGVGSTAGSLQGAFTAGAGAGALPVGTTSYPVPTGAIYVARTGSDITGNGAASAPYASLTKAHTAVAAGGTIVLRGGTYSNVGTDTQDQTGHLGTVITKAITIQSYPGEAVWFDGSALKTAWTLGATGQWGTAYDRLLDRSPTNARGVADTGGTNWTWVNPSYPLAPWPDMVLYDGVPLTPVSSLAAVGPGKFFVTGASTGTGLWFRATRVTIGNDPTGHEVRVTSKVSAIQLNAAGATLRGIGIRRYSNSNPDKGVLYCSGSGNTIENVVIEDTSDDGLSFSGARHTARKVSVKRAGALAIQAYQADNLTVDRPSVDTANTHRWNYSPQAGGFKFGACQTVTIRNAVFANIFGKAIWSDLSCNNITIVNTVIRNAADWAIKLEISSLALIANVLIDNSPGIQINNTDLARIWNITTRNSPTRAVTYDQDKRRATDPAYAYNLDKRQSAAYYAVASHQWQINSVVVHNSVLSTETGASNSMLAVDDHQRSSGTARPPSAYHIDTARNLYHWVTKPAYSLMVPGLAGGTANVSVYQTLAAYQGAGYGTSAAFSAAKVLGTDNNLLDANLHGTVPLALPADVAAAIGVATGSKHLGAFV